MSSAPTPVTVHVVDDDAAARDSLEALLISAGHQVRTHVSGDAFLTAYQPDWVGCAILDVRMPGRSGLEVQHALRAQDALLPVIIVAGHGDLPMAVRAMQAGALDFLEKPYDEARLFESVDLALKAGQESADRRQVIRQLQARYDQLTPREREVMVQVALGHPNKVVAHKLGISARTVEIHRARVIEKMQARSLSHLVRMALQMTLLAA